MANLTTTGPHEPDHIRLARYYYYQRWVWRLRLENRIASTIAGLAFVMRVHNTGFRA